MDLFRHLGDINLIAVIAATIVAFMLGGLWYSKSLFGTKWMQEIGLTEESADQTHVARTFITTFVLQFFAATALAVIIGPNSSWLAGLHIGVLVGLLLVATAYGITYLFEQRSIRLFLINAGFYVVQFAIMGTILGAWHPY